MSVIPRLNLFIPLRSLCLVTTSALPFSIQAADLTRDNGAAVGDNQNSQTAGPDGPVLLQDVQLIQKLNVFPSRWCMLAAPAPMVCSLPPTTSATSHFNTTR